LGRLPDLHAGRDGVISLRNFSYRFEGAEAPVLRDVCLDVAPGDFLVVTGPSGSGKSTLALALSGFLFNQYGGVATGSIIVDGLDVGQAPIYEVAEVVGLVQQNPEAQFCTLTVLDEVAFGLENRCLPREEILTRVDWALDVVGAAHLRHRELATLSGGEQQRVAVASMLVGRPKVLIFDEPTSNLDPPATAAIFDVIARVRETAALTVIVIEHKTEYLRRFEPRWIRVDGGMVAEADRPPMAMWRAVRRKGVDGAGRVGHGDTVARLDRVSVGYGGGWVLQDLSLSLNAGEFVVLMGDNGSGKSTLLQSLVGFLKPVQGRVEILGYDTQRTPISQLARYVGYLFQNPDHQLFGDTVWEEAILAPRNFGMLDDGRRAEIERWVERVGLQGREADPPFRLSYGQKRRLNLISVLGHAPRLLLLDEVLIGQDPGNAAFVLTLLRETADRGVGVLLVSHAPEVVATYADRVLFLSEGRVVVDAGPDEASVQLAALGCWAYVGSAEDIPQRLADGGEG